MSPVDGGMTTVERVLALHDRSLAEHGGRPGPANAVDCVDAAIGASNNAEFYFQGRRHSRAGLVFAAHLLYYLVMRHCFVDGNKRTAWAAAMDVLAIDGLSVVATDDEAEAFVVAIIAHEIKDGSAVAEWLAPRLYALG